MPQKTRRGSVKDGAAGDRGTDQRKSYRQAMLDPSRLTLPRNQSLTSPPGKSAHLAAIFYHNPTNFQRNWRCDYGNHISWLSIAQNYLKEIVGRGGGPLAFYIMITTYVGTMRPKIVKENKDNPNWSLHPRMIGE